MNSRIILISMLWAQMSWGLGDYTEVINEVENSGEMFDYSEEKKVSFKKLEKPKREISVIVTEEGYYPRKISVFKNEEVTFYVTSTFDGPGCFIIAGKKLFLAAIKGKVHEGTIVFKNPGAYKIYCPSQKKVTGKLVVLEKKKTKKEIERGLASDRRQRALARKNWKPKDYPTKVNPYDQY